MLPLPALEGVLPGLTPPCGGRVVETVAAVPVPPAAWAAALAEPTRVDGELPAFVHLGFPRPVVARGAGLAVGDRRETDFVHAGRVGTLEVVVEEAEAEPAAGRGRVRFGFGENTTKLAGWLDWERVETAWELVPGGTLVRTRVAYRRWARPGLVLRRSDGRRGASASRRLPRRRRAGEARGVPVGAPPDPAAAAWARLACLAVPLSLLVALRLLRRQVAAGPAEVDPAAERAGLLMAAGWAAVVLLVGNAAAVAAGLWAFRVDELRLVGTPVDLWLGWTILWGPLAARLAARRMPLAAVVVGLVALDAAAMPWLGSLVRLDQHWLAADALLAIASVVPAVALDRWVRRRQRPVRGRRCRGSASRSASACSCRRPCWAWSPRSGRERELEVASRCRGAASLGSSSSSRRGARLDDPRRLGAGAAGRRRAAAAGPDATPGDHRPVRGARQPDAGGGGRLLRRPGNCAAAAGAAAGHARDARLRHRLGSPARARGAARPLRRCLARLPHGGLRVDPTASAAPCLSTGGGKGGHPATCRGLEESAGNTPRDL